MGIFGPGEEREMSLHRPPSLTGFGEEEERRKGSQHKKGVIPFLGVIKKKKKIFL